MSAEYDLQVAIYQKLSAELDVPVFDDVPDNEEAPYVVVGDDNFIAFDMDGKTGFEVTITIHSWTRFRGREHIKYLQGQIYDVLHRQQLQLDRYNVITVARETSMSVLDPDNIHRHGVCTYRVLMVFDPDALYT
jgi:hypothetical protein